MCIRDRHKTLILLGKRVVLQGPRRCMQSAEQGRGYARPRERVNRAVAGLVYLETAGASAQANDIGAVGPGQASAWKSC